MKIDRAYYSQALKCKPAPEPPQAEESRVESRTINPYVTYPVRLCGWKSHFQKHGLGGHPVWQVVPGPHLSTEPVVSLGTELLEELQRLVNRRTVYYSSERRTYSRPDCMSSIQDLNRKGTSKECRSQLVLQVVPFKAAECCNELGDLSIGGKLCKWFT